MPNVVVYLGAKNEAALRAEGHDPAKWVREAVKRALSERGDVGVTQSRLLSAPASRSESATFKGPDPKPGKRK